MEATDVKRHDTNISFFLQSISQSNFNSLSTMILILVCDSVLARYPQEILDLQL